MQHLILLLDGPMQSWGGTAPFWPERPTELMPTLSGIAGLIANALGADRCDHLTGVADAEMHVRADRPGRRVEDYHTVGGGDPGGGVPQTGKGKNHKRSNAAIITRRHYLADAAFIVHWTPGVGLDTVDVADALRSPRRPLYLGRRSCPPALPPLLGLTSLNADETFKTLPLLLAPDPAPDDDYFTAIGRAAHTISTICQSPGRPGEPNSEARYDIPITFDPALRWQSAGCRWVRNYAVTHTADQCAGRGRAGREAMLQALTAPHPRP